MHKKVFIKLHSKRYVYIDYLFFVDRRHFDLMNALGEMRVQTDRVWTVLASRGAIFYIGLA